MLGCSLMDRRVLNRRADFLANHNGSLLPIYPVFFAKAPMRLDRVAVHRVIRSNESKNVRSFIERSKLSHHR